MPGARPFSNRERIEHGAEGRFVDGRAQLGVGAFAFPGEILDILDRESRAHGGTKPPTSYIVIR